jgi:hypothetical protein
MPARTLPISQWAASSWNWLTPASACLLAMLVFVTGNSHHQTHFETKDNATFFASLMLNALSSSNLDRSISQPFALSKNDVNCEWNIWPHASIPSENQIPKPAWINAVSLAATNRLTP